MNLSKEYILSQFGAITRTYILNSKVALLFKS